ncbi:ribbon-helix-helix domain-containing protein [Shimia aestuarii]|uniref:Ribbon-helix-helix domain-containing protein n=1 Tax=Shimia aestuarii TaxID=254406 RepID=A0A1I4IPW9_9RHOB|nr:ribbon-helix-helix domain-containing protein [Shimia aestuarii]SFL56043.1 Ribbon-helix-helix domain-containing protein [Shimia aestuarii]
MSKTIAVTLTDKQRQAVDDLSARLEVPRTVIVRQAVAAYLVKMERETDLLRGAV